jgi:anaerobic selenocysteine-containing dehydrogenase
MEFTRRKFLGMTGAAAGLSFLPLEWDELLGAISESEHRWPGPGVETWKNSVCHLCPGGCGIRVRLLDGWPVKIRGNPDHPINQGGLCPKGNAGLQVLYNPDRIRRPLKRVGARGEGKWEEISWEEGIGQVAEHLGRLRERGSPEGLVVIGGHYRGFMRALWNRFLAAYGSPNYVTTAIGCDASDTVLHLTQGVQGHIGYDLENTDYLLSFGVNLLEGSWAPVWQMRAYADLRQGRPGHRVKIVQVDPRLSMSAAKSDEWLPVRPGTDGALALGIAHVLVRDDLLDKDFLSRHAFGFEDWTDGAGRRHEGFRTMVLRDYPTDKVAKITGVPQNKVERVAREFGTVRPAIAMADRGASRYGNGLYTRWAIHSLNALVGSVERPGGILVPPEIPFTPLPPLPADDRAERGRTRPRLDGAAATASPLPESAIQRLPGALRSGRPYRAEAVFLYESNPVFSLPRTLHMREALERVPLIVSFSPYLDESANAADLVLPDHTYLERWQDDPTPRNLGFPVFGIRQPVRPPLYDTRATSDVLFAIADAIGDPLRAALPWKDTETFLKERVRGVFEAKWGMRGAALKNPWYESFRKANTADPPTSFEAFWTELLERGAWWNPEYRFEDWSRTLRTPSGKFEFYSQTLEKALATAPAAIPPARRPPGDLAYLPHFDPPEAEGHLNQYPLLLNVFRPLAFYGGRLANVPYLLEIAGKHVAVPWGGWVEINPSTARRFGIGEKEMIWVESSLGKVKVLAKLHPGAAPDVVNMPYGLGHQTAGRWAKGLGVNPNDLVGATTMSGAGAFVYPLMRVKVYKA